MLSQKLREEAARIFAGCEDAALRELAIKLCSGIIYFGGSRFGEGWGCHRPGGEGLASIHAILPMPCSVCADAKRFWRQQVW